MNMSQFSDYLRFPCLWIKMFSPNLHLPPVFSLHQKFTGHSTAVTTLRFATTRPPDSNGLYFLSGAAHDRLLSVWLVMNATALLPIDPQYTGVVLCCM